MLTQLHIESRDYWLTRVPSVRSSKLCDSSADDSFDWRMRAALIPTDRSIIGCILQIAVIASCLFHQMER